MERSADAHSAPAERRRWEVPVGLALVAAFVPAGHHVWLIGTSLDPPGLGHGLFVLHTAAGLAVAGSGLRRGRPRDRLLCLPVLLFFAAVVGLLYLRGHP